jgi:hypothetical protein
MEATIGFSAQFAQGSQAAGISRTSRASQAFFSSKDDYLAFIHAWKWLTQQRDPVTQRRLSLPPAAYAGYALLRGRDPLKGFSRNNRGHGQDPVGAASRALASLKGKHSRPNFKSLTRHLHESSAAVSTDTGAWLPADRLDRAFERLASLSVSAGADVIGEAQARLQREGLPC